MGKPFRSSVAPRRLGAALALSLAALSIAVGWPPGSAGGTRPGYHEGVRDAVMHGVRADFAAGTGVGGSGFRSCFERHFRRALTPSTIDDLATVYRRPGGAPYVAQVLTDMGSPLAARCGHRAWVPELTEAAQALSFGHGSGDAARELGITYGPYLGIRCDYHRRRGCEKVGIDIVFRRAATRVVAIAGEQKIVLRTPGKHDGVRDHDWVGTFTHADILPDRPYELKAEPIYAGVELRVRFAGGARARAYLPHALISPGWG
jgi:hypothetical protein